MYAATRLDSARLSPVCTRPYAATVGTATRNTKNAMSPASIGGARALAAQHDRDQHREHRDRRADHDGVRRRRAREAVDEQLLVQHVAEQRAQRDERDVAFRPRERAAPPREQREHERATDGANERNR